jgi:hypothetical protein
VEVIPGPAFADVVDRAEVAATVQTALAVERAGVQDLVAGRNVFRRSATNWLPGRSMHAAVPFVYAARKRPVAPAYDSAVIVCDVSVGVPTVVTMAVAVSIETNVLVSVSEFGPTKPTSPPPGIAATAEKPKTGVPPAVFSAPMKASCAADVVATR